MRHNLRAINFTISQIFKNRKWELFIEKFFCHSCPLATPFCFSFPHPTTVSYYLFSTHPSRIYGYISTYYLSYFFTHKVVYQNLTPCLFYLTIYFREYVSVHCFMAVEYSIYKLLQTCISWLCLKVILSNNSFKYACTSVSE